MQAAWLKVGLAQRDVPAHITQEYCHPDRSFDDVTQNKSLLDASNPAHLKCSLRFFNWDIDEVRANDLKQSLESLSQPPEVQSSQSYGM